MITTRKAEERGHFDFGWLDTYHTFSFGEYHDRNNMGFRALRVINEDRVAGGEGFPPHPHRDMEIITYILEGAIEHKDSLGTGSVIRPGDGQRMSAGSGIRHSEGNASQTDPVHLLQIWILPEKNGIQPGYEQKSFPREEKLGKLRVIASPDGREGSVRIHQDASLYVALLEPKQQVTHSLADGRYGWLQIARGSVKLNGKELKQGDGAAISDEKQITIEGVESAEILLFDLA
jgi:redox-sensitive bicupin YhaK (pirin superfamily)